MIDYVYYIYNIAIKYQVYKFLITYVYIYIEYVYIVDR